jgi:trans-aconitate 3-methyltransferase
MAQQQQRPSDPTFRRYTPDQAKLYADGRRHAYSQSLYEIIFHYHAETGGQFDTLLDVGCGPGNATRDLALAFDVAIGVDPGEQMIATARDDSGKTATGRKVLFEVLPAEECASIRATKSWEEVMKSRQKESEDPVEGVDLLTAAMAVSCLSFPVPRFVL